MPRTPEEPKRWKRQEIRGAEATNQETGELIQLGNISGMVAAAPRRKTKRKEMKFVMVNVSMEAMPRLRMVASEWSLFWTLASYVDLERGEARVSTKELSEQLERLPQDTSRALGRLRKRNILIKEGQGVWRINPHILARGQVEQWEIDLRTAPEVDWQGTNR